jgi:ABC-type transporter Mla MlaB component
MTHTTQDTITCRSELLDYREAAAVATELKAAGRDALVRIDLSAVENATTAAFAVLIELRAQLRRAGRDLVLYGLRARTAALHALLRLQGVLPTT